MVVRVRYAPSPTGHLHIGGARTALYCYLFAKANGGSCILRIEDTDTGRSQRGSEESQVEDLAWLGIVFDENPLLGGNWGPYRQSERLGIYRKVVDDFIEWGLAYPCFLSREELDHLTEKATQEKKPPHFYHNRYANLDGQEAERKIRAGEEYVIRFKNPGGCYRIDDHVRGEVRWDADMVGDFVIVRANGIPVYNFCCAVDDALMEITHVIRAEDHLNNTPRQLMIYEALGKKPPEFAHCSLLVGEDGKKLSKRHGAASVSRYREDNYLPEAVVNYICLLGWSHPEDKDIFDVQVLGRNFSLSRLAQSPAVYDIMKLNHFNGRYMNMLGADSLVNYLSASVHGADVFHCQSDSWKQKVCALFTPKMNLPSELEDHLRYIFEETLEYTKEFKDGLKIDGIDKVKGFLEEKLADTEGPFISEGELALWMDSLKRRFGIRGKPLFMGMRIVLTGRTQGPDLKTLIALTPVEVLRHRLKNL